LVAIDDNRFMKLKKVLVSLNFNKHIIWSNDSPKLQSNWFEIRTSEKVAFNWSGIRIFLMYSSNFYIFLFGLDFLSRFITRFLFNYEIMHMTQVIMIWAGILFFLPMLWKKQKLKVKNEKKGLYIDIDS